MTTQTFNIHQWLQEPQSTTPQTHPIYTPSDDDIETITQRIEAAHADIAPQYHQWRDLGFALSDHLGENGRTYYHRLSKFYPNCSETETDTQYNICLRATGTGITIKTFFQLAKEAGISVATKSPISPKSPNGDIGDIGNFKMMPTFSNTLQSDLPDILSNILKLSNNPEDADLLLLGSLVVISSCLPNISGRYGGREVFPNLFLFLTAQASTGKGRLTLCRHLVLPVHKELRNIYEAEMMEYKSKLQEYNAAGKKKGKYITIITICSAVAIPISYYIISNWMQQYVYRTTMAWWVYAAAVGLILLITTLTVALHSWNAANENPTNSIMH